MASAHLETLLEGVEALRIIPETKPQPEPKPDAEPPYLLFSPPPIVSWLRDTFDDVPCYLFRVFTPMSRGTTDRVWTRSMDATDGRPNCSQDIFSRNDQQVAAMINRHLRWMHGPEDNLVSWTSSLLFALVYIFHLHASTKDGSVMDDISLCVIDTTKFPRGVFLRDMDLIFAYRSFDTGLKSFEELRQKKHKVFSGSYYFGEYLSQGALNIDGRCRIVSAQRIVDEGLYDLEPEFEEFLEWGSQEKALWAEPVVAHRELFNRSRAEPQGASMEELEAAVNIGQLFGPEWRLPVAANLLALRSRPSRDSGIVLSLRGAPFTGKLPSSRHSSQVKPD
ncbi:hypothetical protein C8A05DRAFT_13283 [Staphylotrichum tortipilum]|uniref:DUF7587 domain-containing protein n=1 Tax=Staphylotrichum tortipilum TaxID=2831512 RepID=A0AAN6MR01_9PEZI|nr:hypothetical protein C8A05DRAFT_13283 [Staphylotrichum longicolle]